MSKLSQGERTQQSNPKVWRERLKQHLTYLVELHDVKDIRRTKQFYGIPELRLLVETLLSGRVLAKVTDCLQYILLFQVMTYGAFRPGSLLRTHFYPDDYSRYEHWEIWTTDVPGAFLVYLTVTSWKGGHTILRFRRRYAFSPTSEDRHLLVDVGVTLVSLGLRRQAFRDHTTYESVLKTPKARLFWKEDYMLLPIFTLKHGQPMTATRAGEILKSTGREACLPDIDNLILYSLRRGAINGMLQSWGMELTKLIVKHKQRSNAVAVNYSRETAQYDATATAMTGKRQQRIVASGVDDAPALYRAAGKPDTSVNATELALDNPGITTLAASIILLRMHLAGSNPLVDFSFLEEPDRQRWISDDQDTPSLLSRLEHRLSTRIKALARTERNRQYIAWDVNGRAQLQTDTVQERRVEQENVSAFVTRLFPNPSFAKFLPGADVLVPQPAMHDEDEDEPEHHPAAQRSARELLIACVNLLVEPTSLIFRQPSCHHG
ncbi:hypothetical protein C8R43DRAFT_147961 [Mycena crocata]|nr:hypothetical protein C8R43DRAFT_147961 [Mycena crocata]